VTAGFIENPPSPGAGRGGAEQETLALEPDMEGFSAARGNLLTLFAVSVLVGLGVAVYEVALPLYFKSIGFSWTHMGWVYGASALLALVMRVGMGAWSDRSGRKIVYVLSLAVTAAATALTPAFRALWPQAALRSVAEPAMRVREAMHATLLYDDCPADFRKHFSRTRGVEFFFHFWGLLGAAWALGALARRGVATPVRWVFLGAAAGLGLAGLVFAVFYRQHAARAAAGARVTWGDFLRPRLTRPMWILTLSTFIFSFGIGLSHCYALQLFFTEKFGASQRDVFVLGALHRLASCIPLLFVGHLFRRRLKEWLMLLLVVEGVFLAAPAFINGGWTGRLAGLPVGALWVAVGVWLIHDLLGMGVWLPIQQELLQRYGGAATRGRDISLSQALGALGAVAAPFVAGWAREWPGLPGGVAINLPFVLSGLGVLLSAAPLLALPGDEGGAPRRQGGAA